MATTTTKGCLLPYHFLPTPMRGEPCNFGESRKLKQTQGLEAQTNKQQRIIVDRPWGPSRHGEILLVRGSQRRACTSRLRLPVRVLFCGDSLILSMYRDKLPNVHCSRVDH